MPRKKNAPAVFNCGFMQRTFHGSFISTLTDPYFVQCVQCIIVLYIRECNITAINRRVMWREQFSSFITAKDEKMVFLVAHMTESSQAFVKLIISNRYNVSLKSAQRVVVAENGFMCATVLRWMKCTRTCKTSLEVIHIFVRGAKTRRARILVQEVAIAIYIISVGKRIQKSCSRACLSHSLLRAVEEPCEF